MWISKRKDDSLIIEVKNNVTSILDHDGGTMFYITLPPIAELFRTLPSPILEDFFHHANLELNHRDKVWIDQTFQGEE